MGLEGREGGKKGASGSWGQGGRKTARRNAGRQEEKRKLGPAGMRGGRDEEKQR